MFLALIFTDFQEHLKNLFKVIFILIEKMLLRNYFILNTLFMFYNDHLI